ncbi:MAG: S49 family peptidase [Phycisphaeraceae bacterium]|nr:S49 family peptidase [Phycisphaeraceae bacterium]
MRPTRPLITLAAGLLLLSAGANAALAQARERVGMLEITGTPSEAPSQVAWLFGDADPTLSDLVRAIENAQAAHNLDHLVIRLKDAALSWAHVDELGQAISTVDIPVTLFAEQMGPTDLMLASYADRVLMQQAGDVSLPGLYMEEMFLADTLHWIGLKAQLIQVGDYKGANEQMTRTQPSEAWNQNIEALLDSLYGHMVGTLARGRGTDASGIEGAMGTLWMASAQDAVTAGLVDQAIDLPELGRTIVGPGANPRWITINAGQQGSKLDTSNPFALFQMLSRKPEVSITGPTIAVLHLSGTIMTGDSSSGGLFGGQTIGSRTIRNELKALADNDLVRGVVLRIDSPGGSATASEIIWQGVQELRKTKPVWVSVGNMAASGGYYIAVAGDKIYANPSSILGSIGVVGGKISMAELYDTLKVNVVGRARGPRADMFASAEPWNEQQVTVVRDKMAEVYQKFTGRVSAGRPGIDLSKTAEGRLFLGKDAVGLKMADKVGGLDDAVADLAGQLGLAAYDVQHFPGPKELGEILEEMLGGFMSVRGPGVGNASDLPTVRALRAALGERAWGQVMHSMESFSLLRQEPVVLTAPSIVTFR